MFSDTNLIHDFKASLYFHVTLCSLENWWKPESFTLFVGFSGFPNKLELKPFHVFFFPTEVFYIYFAEVSISPFLAPSSANPKCDTDNIFFFFKSKELWILLFNYFCIFFYF